MIKAVIRFFVFLFVAAAAFFGGKKSGVPAVVLPSRPAAKNRWVLAAGVLLAILLFGGFLLAASGLLSIKASSRHWAITRWFLNFAKERSVATHTVGTKAPPLESRLLVMKGAAHYEIGCRPCHGSPGKPQPRVPHGMTPPPPPLQNIRSKFDETELFYIVKHGIKFTGMPAWPAENRDDEIWAVVAFLRALPEIDSREYQRLAMGEKNGAADPLRGRLASEGAAKVILDSCSRCHGVDGLGRGTGAFPKIAGQKQEYLLASLAAYASGERNSGIMEPIANGLDPELIPKLADYYSTLSPESRSSENRDEKAIERGRAIASMGIPAQRVPACVECHGPATAPRNETYPQLAGQYADYLILQLELFKARARGGTSYSHLMHFVVGGLTEQQISDVAEFFADLNPEADGTGADRN